MRRGIACFVVPAIAFLGLIVSAGDAGATPSGDPTRVGSAPVHRCDLGVGRPTWCGAVTVPLDYTDASAATIDIGFGWVPAAAPAGARTFVAQEGGPGYPSTGTAPDFAAMAGPLLQHRNLLVVDARGTGRSAAIDCAPLQSLPSPSPRFAAAAAACGRQLNHTFRRHDGSFVHASDLFTTADSARDLARVLTALRTGRVDLYGDSYGTYFAQAFLSRYPSLLRSVVLDSAYEARDLDPWYRTTVTTARRAFDRACSRAIACPPGSSWQRITQLTRLLRQHPIEGRVPDTAGGYTHVRFDVTALVNVVNDAGYDTEPYRQLDAAVRAYLERRDATPLLRLYAQDIGWDYSDYSAAARDYSDGLYLAVACTDYPQLFDMSSGPAVRRAQLARSVRRLPASTFAPFTTREWLTVLPYTETFTGCLDWPAPTHRPDPPVPSGHPLNPGHVPVLILNGEFDSLTPAAGGAHIARQLHAAAQTVVAANNVHLVALDSAYACGPSLVRRFVADPTTRVDASCAAGIPTIRTVPRFPRTLAETMPADGSGTTTDRRLAAVAVAAAGDAVNRYTIVDNGHDHGLRGGTVVHTDTAARLNAVHWTVDTSTSGTVTLTDDGAAATLTVRGPAGVTRTVHLRWDAGRYATARIGDATYRVPAP